MTYYQDYFTDPRLTQHRSVPSRVALIIGYRDGEYGKVARAFARALGRPDEGVRTAPTADVLWSLMRSVDDALDGQPATAGARAERMARLAVQEPTRGEALDVLEELGYGDFHLPAITVQDAAPFYRTALAGQLMLCLRDRFDGDWQPYFRGGRKR